MSDGGLKAPGNFLKQLNNTANPSEASRSWTNWLQQFDFYMVASEKDAKDETVQVATLLTLLGEEGQELFRSFEITDPNRKKIKNVKEAFTKYFAPRVREEFERFKFYSRVQSRNESFDSFLTAIQALIRTCNFHADERNKALRDRIVFGINTTSVREELFNIDGELTLDRCVQVCRRVEATKQYLSHMSQQEVEVFTAPKQAADAVTDNPTSPKYQSNQKNTNNHPTTNARNNNSRNITNCRYCGGTHPPRRCPAYGKVCANCSIRNHLAKVCRSGKNVPNINTASEVAETQHQDPDAQEYEPQFQSADISYTVNSHSPNSRSHESKEWHISVKCGDSALKLKVDTGASCNVMPKSVLDNLNVANPRLTRHNGSLTSFGGHKLSIVGKISLMLERNDAFTVHDFIVVEQGQTTLLGLPSCIDIGLVNVVCAINNNNITSQYTDVFDGLGKLPCMHALRLKEGHKPVVQSARRVPFRLRDKLKSTLDSMESTGTIAKVRIPTDWVHPIVNVLKPNGSLRVCLDPTELNRCIKREHFTLPTATEIFSKLANSTVFTTLDATSGFLQLELDEESSYLTTFATPYGRYRFLRLPYGISSAPEVFHRTINEIFSDIQGVETYVDDLLIHAQTQEEHDSILVKVLDRCRSVNLRLNYSKCAFQRSELKYLGHIIGQGVIKPDPAKVTAIENMPTPNTHEEVRRLLGMATYLSKFCPNLSEVTAPLRELTKKKAAWVWGDKEEKSLAQLKKMLTSGQALKIFDPREPITLSVDSSQNGMGAVILQNSQPVEFASCSLTHAQRGYAQIEKEFLAVHYGLTRFHQYVYGQTVTIETDHLPLLGIVKKGLNDLTPRILRMRLRTTFYDYVLVYKPGSQLFIADTLSRAYVDKPCNEGDNFTIRDRDQIHAVVTGTLSNSKFRDTFTTATVNDPSLEILKSYINNGWPQNKQSCVEPLKAFWSIKADLAIHNSIILKSNQLVVPLSMRKHMISEIHKGHLGISKCIERAKNSVYWPGYLSQIKDAVESCTTCQENTRASVHTRLEPYDIPEYPMQTISTDIFHLLGREYLVTVDRYSKWPSCTELRTSTSREIITILKQQFLDFGRPETIISDNASYYTSNEFQSFMDTNDIKHITTSPYYSRSNGLAERMNQTIKTSLNKAIQSKQELSDVLTTLRTTPLGDSLPSPAVLLQGRNLRTSLNCMPSQLKTQAVNNQKVVESFQKRQAQTQMHNSNYHRPKEFVTGMNVWVNMGHRKWVEGTILAHAETPHSFYVKLEGGKTTRRNQSFLRSRKVTTTSFSAKPAETSAVERVVNTAPQINTRVVDSQTPVAPSDVSVNREGGLGQQAASNGGGIVTGSGRVSKPPNRYGQNIFN